MPEVEINDPALEAKLGGKTAPVAQAGGVTSATTRPRPVAQAGGTKGEQRAPAPLDDLQAGQLRAIEETERRGGFTAEQYANFEKQRGAIPEFDRSINELRTIYTDKFAGKKGNIFGFGGSRNVGGYLPGAMRTQNRKFEQAGDALMGQLIQMYDTTGGEVNSVAELNRRFGPLLPKPWESDEEIDVKIKRLRRLATGQQRVLNYTARRLKIEADEEGGPGGGMAETAPAPDPAQSEDPQLAAATVAAPGGPTPPTIGGPGIGAGPGTPGGGIPGMSGPPTPINAAMVQPGEQITRTPNAVYGDVNQQALATGGMKDVPNPALAGANAMVNAAVRSKKTTPEILGALKAEYHMTDTALTDIGAKIDRARGWLEGEGKGYTGPFPVDLEKMSVPTTASEQALMNPAGTTGITAMDTLSGGHLDNALSLFGADPAKVEQDIAALRQANPKAATLGDIVGAGAAYYGGGRLLKAGMEGYEAIQAARSGIPAAEAGATSMAEIEAAIAADRAAASGAQGARNFIPPRLSSEAIPAVPALSGRAVAADAALGGYEQSGKGTTDWIDPEQAFKGATLAGVTGIPVRGTLNTAGAVISPTGGRLAPIFEAGGSASPGQIAGSTDTWLGNIVNKAEDLVSRIPGGGMVQAWSRKKAVDEMQRGWFNEALGDLKPFEKFFPGVSKLPGKVMKGAKAQGHLENRINTAYDKARSMMTVADDPDFQAGLAALRQSGKDDLSKESQAILERRIAAFEKKLAGSPGGVMGGDAYKTFVSELAEAGAKHGKNDAVLGTLFGNFRQVIDDAAKRSSTPEAVALLDAADTAFGKAVIIMNAGERASSKSFRPGEFAGEEALAAAKEADPTKRSQAYLSGRAKGQRYAEAAQELGQPPSRELTQEGALLGGAGAAALGGSAAAIGTGTGGILGAAPAILYGANTVANLPGVRGAINSMVRPWGKGIKPYADVWRRQLELTAKFGGPLIIPVRDAAAEKALNEAE